MTKENFVTVRYESHGEKFEILVKPKEAFDFRSGRPISISDIVVSDTVYKDIKKGQKASPSSLKKVFGTLDYDTIVKEILYKGEIPVTSEQRKELLEKKKKQVIDFIHRNAVDPKTGLPIPPNRIEAAMEQARVHVDMDKETEAQAMQIVKEITKIIPIKIARALLQISVPSQYSAKVKSSLSSLGDVKKTQWLGDGTLMAELEIPAGAQQEVIDKLNSLTKGDVEVKVLQFR